MSGFIDPAQGSMSLLDALGLPALPKLPAHLLHPAQTHPIQLSKLRLAALAAGIGFQKLSAQIVIVGSRHTLRGSHQSHYLIVTLKMI